MLDRVRVQAMEALAHASDVVANIDTDCPDDQDYRDVALICDETRERLDTLRQALHRAR